MTKSSHRRFRAPLHAAIAVVALAGFAVACGDDDDDVITEPTPVEEPTTAPTAEPTDDGATDDGATDDGTTDDAGTDGAGTDGAGTDEAATDGSTTDGGGATDGTDTRTDTIAITYACGNGESGSADIPTNDIEEIDDIVNTIDFCEFRGGLSSISFTAPCPSGDRDVTIQAVDGGIPDIATLDLCENEG